MSDERPHRGADDPALSSGQNVPGNTEKASEASQARSDNDQDAPTASQAKAEQTKPDRTVLVATIGAVALVLGALIGLFKDVPGELMKRWWPPNATPTAMATATTVAAISTITPPTATPTPAPKCQALELDGVSGYAIFYPVDHIKPRSFTIEISIMLLSPLGRDLSRIISKNYGGRKYETFGLYIDFRPPQDKADLVGAVYHNKGYRDTDGPDDQSYLNFSKAHKEFDPLQRLNSWMHIAYTYNEASSEMKTFVNGEVFGEEKGPSILEYDDQSIFLGAEWEGKGPRNYFHGQIDEVRIWELPLDPKVIQRQMDKHFTGSETGLLAYYPFDGDTERSVRDYTGKDKKGGSLEGAAKLVERPCPPPAPQA